MATMYVRKSRLSPRQQGKLIDHFVAGSTARAAAEVVGVQANTAIPQPVRWRIVTSPAFSHSQGQRQTNSATDFGFWFRAIS